MILAAGSEMMKYARKNAVWINMLCARFRVNTCCAKGISTSFSDVRDPQMKNSVVRTASAGA